MLHRVGSKRGGRQTPSTPKGKSEGSPVSPSVGPPPNLPPPPSPDCKSLRPSSASHSKTNRILGGDLKEPGPYRSPSSRLKTIWSASTVAQFLVEIWFFFFVVCFVVCFVVVGWLFFFSSHLFFFFPTFIHSFKKMYKIKSHPLKTYWSMYIKESYKTFKRLFINPSHG